MSGNKHSPLNYRPISLTSIPCKILEHILASNLANFIESNSFFTSSQHGFRKTYSCETQLVSVLHMLNVILDHSSLVDCTFLDFSKAFDKVCHTLLLYKLHQLNLDPKLLIWPECFLVNHSHHIVANNYLSDLFFFLYILMIYLVVSLPIFICLPMTVVFREITCENYINIQSGLNAISVWCKTWRMEFNISKCKFMCVSRKTHNLPVCHLHNSPLDTD